MAAAATALPDQPPETKEDFVAMAKEADIDERYDQMVDLMKRVANMENVDMEVEERSLLAIAYKNVVGARRASWKIISSIEEKEEKRGDQEKLEMIRTYKEQIIKELTDICNDIFRLLDRLIPKANEESKVFYHKMQGDYNRYMAEWSPRDTKESHKTTSRSAYEKATDLANFKLPTTNPVRLGVALCFSMFIYEIEEKHTEAFEVAYGAFDNAIGDLDTLPDEVYKDATHLMQLIRDNLLQWKRDARERGEPMEEDDDDDYYDDDDDFYDSSSSGSESSMSSISDDPGMSD